MNYELIRSLLLALLLLISNGTMVSAADASSSAAASWANKMGLREGDNITPLGIRYTKEHPLIIVADWVMPPYSFMNDNGEPDGFEIQLFHEVFTKLHVPYEIHLKDALVARHEIFTGKAQLMIDMKRLQEKDSVFFGNEVLAQYPIGVIRQCSTRPLHSIELFSATDTIHTNLDDYVDQYLDNYFSDTTRFVHLHRDTHNAIADVLDGKIKYFICGKVELQDVIKRFGLGNTLVVDDIDIPAAQLHFISNDLTLLRQLDAQFVRLKGMHRYQPIADRWLSESGEYEEDTTLANILIVVGMIILVVAGIIFFVLVVRNSGGGNLKREFKAIANMSIIATDCNVFAINLKRQWVYNVSGDFLPPEGVSYPDYEKMIHPDDYIIQTEARRDVDEGEKSMPTVSFRMRKYRGAADDWRNVVVNAYIKTNHQDEPTYVYLAVYDETDRINEQTLLERILCEFSHITEISELAMVYYDVDGRFVNCNRAMIQLLDKGGTGKAEQFIRQTTIQQMPVLLNGFSPEPGEDAWFCAPLDLPELNLHVNTEMRVESVNDEQGHCKGYSFGIIDLTEHIALRRDMAALKRREQRMRKGIERYQQETAFVLQQNRMLAFRWRIGNEFFEMSDDLVTIKGTVPFSAFIEAMNTEYNEQLTIIQQDPKQFFARPFCTLLALHVEGKFPFLNMKQGNKRWFTFSVSPEYNENGHFIGAHGLMMDVTPYQQAKEALRNA